MREGGSEGVMDGETEGVREERKRGKEERRKRGTEGGKGARFGEGSSSKPLWRHSVSLLELCYVHFRNCVSIS